MKCELTLRPADTPQRNACAWFVPGNSAEAWLNALADLAIDQARAKLLVVPHSATDRRPLGALIVAKPKHGTSPDNQEPKPSPFVHAYGCIAGRLYVPVEGVLSPPATDAELAELFADDQLYVWHPVAGLTPFATADCLAPAELLGSPVESPADWNRAVPGVAINTRLLSLSVEVTPTVMQLMEEVRGDIGSQSSDLTRLPPIPNERGPGLLSRAVVGLAAAFANFLEWLTNSGEKSTEQAEADPAARSRRARLIGWSIVLLAVGLFLYFDLRNWSSPDTPQSTVTPPSTSPTPITPHQANPLPPNSPSQPITPSSPLLPIGIWGVGILTSLLVLAAVYWALRARRGPISTSAIGRIGRIVLACAMIVGLGLLLSSAGAILPHHSAWQTMLHVVVAVIFMSLMLLAVALLVAIVIEAVRRSHAAHPSPRQPAPLPMSTLAAPNAGKLTAVIVVALVLLAIYGDLFSKMHPEDIVGILAGIAVLTYLIYWALNLFAMISRIGASRRAAQRPMNAGPSPAARSTPAGPGWFARLKAWASGKVQQAAAAIEAARHRELDRLMNLLDQNPDEGLRFALPLAGDAMRGLAPPGARLPNRTVDYGRGGGGRGPADVWNVHEEYRRKLTLRYRELANREIGLGRHRRAAYIFAELLGDWNAAAKTLADGAHYREAAVIYDERLRRPLEAAQCLERGGLTTEAIVIYERLNQHEKVGDLYMQLEQVADAEVAYRRAVEGKRSAQDRLGAAVLLEEKLAVPDEAWDELAGGWPNSPQAAGCLRAAFDWTERHNDFERAKRHLKQASAAARSSGQVTQFVERSVALATGYPEPGVRAAAAETTLAVASPRLPHAPEAELKALTAAIRQLSPDDRLLSRDCDRFARLRTQPTKYPATPWRSDKQLQLRLKSKFPFENVRACVASADTIYAAGWREQHLVIARANWEGKFHYPDAPPWPYPKATPETPILLAVGQREETHLRVHPLGLREVGYPRAFPETDDFRRRVMAGDGGELSLDTFGLAWDVGNSRHTVQCDRQSSELTFHTYASNSQSLLATHSCPILGDLRWPLPYQLREGLHYVAMGHLVYFLRVNELKLLAECGDDIVRLVVSPDHTRPRLIAVFEQGAQILWGVTRGVASTRFAENLVAPQVLIHRDGWIIAADRRRCEVYSTRGESLRLHTSLEWEDLGEIIALVTSPATNVFAAVDTSGHIRQYHIPPTD